MTLQRLEAPVAGTVQQVSIHTIGGVVTPAQPLMVIVPEGDELIVEAWISNQDIGFVRAGQAATIKVDSFPFIRYGAIEGRVTTVSTDSIADDARGLVYAVQLKPERAAMTIDERTVPLSPGMTVSVEVMTGERRVIEYVTSPLVKRAVESARER